MGDYIDKSGFFCKTPLNSIFSSTGNGTAVGIHHALNIKLESSNTNIVVNDTTGYTTSQTNGIVLNVDTIIAEAVIDSKQSRVFTVQIDGWNLTAVIEINSDIFNNIYPADCRIRLITDDGTYISKFKDGTASVNGTRIYVVLYHTLMDFRSEELSGQKECYMLECVCEGNTLGYTGIFTLASAGWLVDGYGITPSKQIVTIKTDENSYGGGINYGDNTSVGAEIPALPTFSYEAHGVRTYLLNDTQSNALHTFMWSNDFVDNLVKMYAQPMQTIESMFINDCNASSERTSNVQLGNVTTDVSASPVSQFIEIDCGTVRYNEEYASYLDYEPYVSFQLYLPRCGYIPISAKDVVNNSIRIVYQIDLVTGYGTAFVYVNRTREGYGTVLMQIPSQMLSHIPFSGTDGSARVNAAAQCVTNLIGGNLLGAGTNAINTLIAPEGVQKTPVSTSLILSVKKPALLVTRSVATIPKSYGEDAGFMCEVSDTLQGKTGFFKIRNAHTPMINNDAEISAEIDRLLEQGVYIK